MGGTSKQSKRRLGKESESFAKEQITHVEKALNMLYSSCQTQCIAIGSNSVPLQYLEMAKDVIIKSYNEGFQEAMKNNESK